MNALALIPQDAIIFHHNQVRTTSNKVAEAFGKQHKHVAEKIRKIECSEQFLTANFSAVKFTHRGNEYDAWEMTKDGFMFLVMGFTGRKAAAVKEAFINAFNSMAEDLAKHAVPEQQKQIPAKVDVRGCLLSQKNQLTIELPEEVVKALDEKAFALGLEAYQLCREHLIQRVAFTSVSGSIKKLNKERALKEIAKGDLGFALAYKYYSELSLMKFAAQGAMTIASDAFNNITMAMESAATSRLAGPGSFSGF